MKTRLDENPFKDLYLTEAISDPGSYIDYFSPAIITGQTESLFSRGNVVLRGSNGVGKTMLLRLLQPDVQAAYLKHDSPLPKQVGNEKSLSIGVNLIHAGFNNLGQRQLCKDPEENVSRWALTVADLLNYYLVGELLKTLRFLHGDGRVVAQAIALLC